MMKYKYLFKFWNGLGSGVISISVSSIHQNCSCIQLRKAVLNVLQCCWLLNVFWFLFTMGSKWECVLVCFALTKQLGTGCWWREEASQDQRFFVLLMMSGLKIREKGRKDCGESTTLPDLGRARCTGIPVVQVDPSEVNYPGLVWRLILWLSSTDKVLEHYSSVCLWGLFWERSLFDW